MGWLRDLVLYETLYDNPDGKYFARTKEDFEENFKMVEEIEWTEEDEDNLNMAIYFMRSENTPYSPTDVEPVVEWLCGLKQRMEE